MTAGDQPPMDALERLFHLGVGLLCLLLLGLGAWLEPSPAGAGTHLRLGLPPCFFLLRTGRPCPTCGVTTSFALACRGRLVDSFRVQPFGLAVWGLCLGGVGLALAALLTGRPRRKRLARLPWTGFLLGLFLMALLSWAWKLLTWEGP